LNKKELIALNWWILETTIKNKSKSTKKVSKKSKKLKK